MQSSIGGGVSKSVTVSFRFLLVILDNTGDVCSMMIGTDSRSTSSNEIVIEAEVVGDEGAGLDVEPLVWTGSMRVLISGD